MRSLSAPRKQEPAELVADAAAPPEAEGDPGRQPPSNALGSAWSLRTIRIVEATPVFPPDVQVRLIVVGGIKRQLQGATDDKYPYRAAEGDQRRWRQFAPDEGFRADTRAYGTWKCQDLYSDWQCRFSRQRSGRDRSARED